MIEEQQITVEVTGKGANKSEAVSKALSTIQKQIFAQLNQLIIRAEPESIDVIDATYSEYTERFLFIFFPRKKLICTANLKVKVNLKTIDPEKINWQKKKS